MEFESPVESFHNTAALWIVKAVYGFTIFISNLLTLMALTQCHQVKESLRYCFINLAITDTMSGLLYVYHSVAYFFPSYNPIECKTRYWFVSMASSVTLFTLSILSLDRLLALEFPLMYDTRVNKKVLLAVTVVCWFVAAIFVTSSVVRYHDVASCSFVKLMRTSSYISLAVGSFSLIAVIIGCHIRIFLQARKQILKILPTMLQEAKATAATRMNIKAAVTTAVVLVPFCFLNIPLFVYFICLGARPDFGTMPYALLVMDILLFFQITNSFLNPLIYAWRLPELRSVFRKKCICCKTKIQPDDSGSQTRTSRVQ